MRGSGPAPLLRGGLVLGSFVLCFTAGCAPACHILTPGSAPHGRSLPLTPQLREAALHNCDLSKGIRRDIVARGSTKLKLVALTFDDGPHPGRTEQLLAVMTRLHVHGTFFVVGKMAQKAPYLIQEEVLQGSEVANHTYNHIHVTSLSDAEIAREIFTTNDLIQRYTGSPAVLFRPPGGRLSWGAYRALRACGMVTVLWTDDPKDYLNPGKPNVAEQHLLMKRLMAHVRPGGIILLHDGILDTVAILPEFVARLRAQGYEFVTATQLMLAQQRAATAQSPVRDALADHLIRADKLVRPSAPFDPAAVGTSSTGALGSYVGASAAPRLARSGPSRYPPSR